MSATSAITMRARRALRRIGPRRDHRTWLLERLPQRSVGVEIGVWKGDFSAEILRTVKPVALHLVDPWSFETGAEYEGARYGGVEAASQSDMDDIQRCGDTPVRAGDLVGRRAHPPCGQLEAASGFDNDTLDWVYIDGNHLYEYVKADLGAYLPKVKPGGFILGDDYGEGGWWQGGVKRAVDEFARADGVTLITTEGRQFLIRKTA